MEADTSMVQGSNQMISNMHMELNDAQNAMEKYATHVADLEGKLKKLQKVDTVHQKVCPQD